MKPALIFILVLLAAAIGAAASYRYIKGPVQIPSPTPSVSSSPTVTAATFTPSSNSPAPTPTGSPGLEVSAPAAGTAISSPVTIIGTATGSWFFEAQFPVKVVAANGAVLGQGTAKAGGDWMTDAPVAFTATITFSAPPTNSGSIVLENDNPSGLPANARSYTVPITFK